MYVNFIAFVIFLLFREAFECYISKADLDYVYSCIWVALDHIVQLISVVRYVKDIFDLFHF